MRLPPTALIAPEKIVHYLLVWQPSGDKSAFLARGGFLASNPTALISALYELRDENDARFIEENDFGRYFEVSGNLQGPLAVKLFVRTIWMTEHLSGVTKFITLIPVELFLI